MKTYQEYLEEIRVRMSKDHLEGHVDHICKEPAFCIGQVRREMMEVSNEIMVMAMTDFLKELRKVTKR